MLLLFLLPIHVSAYGLLSAARAAAPAIHALQSRRAHLCMQMTETVTKQLVNCIEDGVGIGLDKTNRIDMLRPGGGADLAGLQMGDLIVRWNGTPLVDAAGAQVKLGEVVKPAETHTVILERAVSPLAAAEAAAKAEGAEKSAGADDKTTPSDSAWAPTTWASEGSESWQSSGGSSSWGASDSSSGGVDGVDPPDWA